MRKTQRIRTPEPALVQVARDWGGTRVVVPVAKVRYPHLATDTGGIHRQLPHRMLAVYVDCTELGPVSWHACKHGAGPHGIKVLVPRVHNDPETYAALRSRARSFGKKRRALAVK